MKLKSYLILLFILAAIFLLSYTYIQAREPTVKEEISSYKNKQPVLLFFWTTWCPFCRKELRDLNQLYPELKKDDLEVLAIDVGESPDKVKSFIKGYALSFKVLLDKDTVVAQTYSILGVPTYVLVDKKGSVVFQDHYFPRKEYKGLLTE